MKKLKSALLVAALSAAMVLPVLAAPSPAADAFVPDNVTVAVAEADIVDVSQATQKEIESVVSNATHLTNLGVNVAAKLAATFDLEYDGEIPAGGVQIPVKVKNAEVGDYVYLLHRRSDNGQWEVVGQGYLGADKTIVGTFTNFSPVAVMVVDAADAAAAGVKAPKTGEF